MSDEHTAPTRRLPVFGKAHEAEAGDGNFHWFIYGSSLDRAAFVEWAQHHGYRVPDYTHAVRVKLEGYRLAFDVMSNFWGGTVASLVESPGQSVEGLALPLPADARGLVDHKEGAISGLYEPFPAKATPLDGGAPIDVLAYRANAMRRLKTERAPSPRFLEVLIRGARESGLSNEWVAQLESLRA